MKQDFENWINFLNNSTQSVHLVAGDGTILWANDTELEFLGYSEQEYFGKSITEFHIDSDVIDIILNTLIGYGELKAYPARLRAKDAGIKHVLINSNVYRMNDEFIHTRCFTTEISEGVYTLLRQELGQSVEPAE